MIRLSPRRRRNSGQLENLPEAVPEGQRTRPTWPARYPLPELLTVVLGTILSLGTFVVARHWEGQRIQRSFEWAAREQIKSLRWHLELVATAIESVRSFALSSQFIERGEFAEFVKPYPARIPALESLALASRVSQGARADFEASFRREGDEAFQIRQLEADGQLVPSETREEYFPVYRAEPPEVARRLLGCDLGSEHERALALAKARDTGTLVVTAAVRLVTDEEATPGFVAALPIYATNDLPASVAERRELLRGFAIGSFRLANMLKVASFAGSLDAPLQLRAFDGAAEGQETAIGSSRPEARGTPERGDELRYTTTVEFGGRTWTIIASSDPAAWGHAFPWMAWGLLSAGLALTVLLASYLRLTAIRRAEVERLAAERTQQLHHTHQALVDESRERKRAEGGLQEREDQIAGILANAVDGIVTFDDRGEIQSLNAAARRIFGLPTGEFIGRPIDLLGLDLRGQSEASRREAREVVCRRSDGSPITVEVTVGAMVAGEHRLFIACIRDVTERKEMERQLQHAQRLDSIGQLTGGVAHDFNNLLTVVIGNLQLLERRCGEAPRLSKPITAALRSANRGAELTQRLLAFARRQPLQPQALDANQLVLDTVDLMKRTLGSAIRIETLLAQDLWPAHADASQLENSLINLAVNARDAMPQGGLLTLETANAELEPEYTRQQVEVDPGPYVMIAITDTGVGMAPEVVAKAFEPFFTTKEAGKGTGLGLSMVHGFVKQSRGHVRIYSELGRGTTIRMYLPPAAAHDGVGKGRLGLETSSGFSSRGEMVLVVEDEADVREIAVTFLEELGYGVVAAEDGRAALEVLGSHAEIDLLFTDMVMPGGISGHDLAGEVVKRYPEMPVVYCSGYSEAAVFRERALGSRERFLVKPYSREGLSRVVRDALDSEAKE